MARSLGLKAYQALSRRGDARVTPPAIARPDGELVWIHAPEPGGLLAVQNLAARLCSARFGLYVLITMTPSEFRAAHAAGELHPNAIIAKQPGEHPEAVAAFLGHWRPNTCLWLWGALRPNLVLETAARHCQMILLNADTSGFDGRRDRWLPELTRQLLKKFSSILARSAAGQRRLVQLGLNKDDIRLTTALMTAGQALRCPDSDVTEMAQALGGRPVWFAAEVHEQELPVVLAAHRRALRLSHRLLLILSPAKAGDAAIAQAQARDDGFDVWCWDDDGYPDDTTQVLVAEDTADRALFFRVAPVSFLGTSLVADEGGVDPFEAGALGSAVLYGPKVGNYLPSYTRLAAAGAARIVNDAAALGTAVSHLIAPDQAAAMAHAGWDVVSQGAELTDMVIDLAQDALDMAMVRA